ncbi:MAG: hypothetical protein PHZ26_03140 [Candidatus Gracilibacteria bacterium]|nr:hypothetical protein [Candidatus Gracilibacteria bacterium]MDD2908723.1 hypothetical protein [Candidatus Gracilibacteria bacterium]
MKISRELAIIILKYLFKNSKFYFPFIIVCKEYSPEDDDFLEVCPNEWQSIEDNEVYQTFELWENLQNLDEITLKLLSKGFIDNITENNLENEIKTQVKCYKKLYKVKLIESAKIKEYGENEFFGGKVEAYEDVLNILKNYKT